MGGNNKEEEVQPFDAKEVAAQMLKTGATSEEAKQQLSGSPVEEVPDNSIEETSDDSEEQQEETPKPKLGGHPAWQEILDAVPAEYHEQIIPTLKGWDAGVTKRFQEIHSQYEPLKVFEPIADEIDADTLSSAIGLLNAVNTNPEEVWRTMGEAYGFISEQESSDDEDSEEYGSVPPAIAQQLAEQQRAIEALSEFVQSSQTTVEQSQQQEQLDDYLADLTENYGEFDEDYVLTKMAAGVDGEVAVRQYQELVGFTPKQTTTPPAQPPKVLGSSGVGRGGNVAPNGGMPDVTKLGRKETKDLVTEILKSAAEQ